MSFVPENVVEMYDGYQNGVPENVTQNLAPIEVTGTATRAYAVGDYMVFGGLLRKVTQAIAQGGTITVGTNVESTKVSTELQGIHSDLSEKHTEITYENGTSKWDDQLTAYKRGNIVTVGGGVQGLTANTSVIIGTLPSGYRPVMNYFGDGINGGIAGTSKIGIDKAGRIGVYSNEQYAKFSATFICQ